jgi:hypothetical protein
MVETRTLHAGKRSDGSPVLEEVPVRPVSTSQVVILQSPGLVLGVAAGDLLDLKDDGEFEVVTRGGNLCIQVFAKSGIDQLEREMSRGLAAIGGRLDGRAAKELVYTVPVTAGFNAIEDVLKSCVARCEGAEWFYGNVYDPDDGVTPLNWW